MQKNRGIFKETAEALKTAATYVMIGLVAILSAAVLSVLFLAVPVSGGEKSLAVAWKPAYLFSVPEDGDYVVYEGESGLSGGESLKVGYYDGTEMAMEHVRGKVIAVIPLHLF